MQTFGWVSPATLIATCLLCAVLLTRRVARSPLDVAPNSHWSARYSTLWLRWQRYHDWDTIAVHEAHLRHGPVVRLAPGELSVCDARTGLKPIYDGRLPKTDWYQVAVSYGAEPSFAMKDEERHRRRRRMVAKPYSNSSIRTDQDWQSRQTRLADDFRAALHRLSKDRHGVEMFDLVFAWVLASVSIYIFGSTGGVNLLTDLSGARQLQDAYVQERFVGIWVAGWSSLPRKLLGWIGHSTEISCIEQMRLRADKAAEVGNMDAPTESVPTVYEHMKRAMLKAESLGYGAHTEPSTDKRAMLASEIQDHVVAGLDTSQIALTICIWLLSLDNHRMWQDKLRLEIQASGAHSRASVVEGLPILDAIVRETLRLYPPAAGCQPRVTDKTVVLGPEECRIAVPAGVTVHAQAWTLHRDPIVFESAEDWRPDRWLDCSSQQRIAMDASFWAFGSGSRRCIGEHFAMSSLKVALATIYGSFETLVTAETKFTLRIGNFILPLPENGDTLRLRVRDASA